MGGENMKKFILSIVLSSILFGCNYEPPPIAAQASEVKVEDKRQVNYSRGANEYYIMFEKNGERLELRVDENTYKALQKGTTVNVGYSSDNVVRKIEYPNFK
jgi:hypothetical protein